MLHNRQLQKGSEEAGLDVVSEGPELLSAGKGGAWEPLAEAPGPF